MGIMGCPAVAALSREARGVTGLAPHPLTRWAQTRHRCRWRPMLLPCQRLQDNTHSISDSGLRCNRLCPDQMPLAPLPNTKCWSNGPIPVLGLSYSKNCCNQEHVGDIEFVDASAVAQPPRHKPYRGGGFAFKVAALYLTGFDEVGACIINPII